MKKKLFIVLCLYVVATLLQVTAAASSFPDVPDDAAYAEAVEYLSDIGVMRGNAQGNFNPDGYVTRAQMAAIICRMLECTENLTTDGNRFTDVPTSHWANTYIVEAEELGIISGYQDGSFKPENTITYEQAIKMIVSSMGLAEIAKKDGGYPNGYISVANNYGYSDGLTAQKGELLKRWEIATMVYNCVG